MTLTVITINYNNLEGLRRTVPTVVAQTFQDFEYIVIDGGSTDGSREYIEHEPRIDYWVSEHDHGIYNAMNKAVARASSEYCLFMNSGDMFFSPMVLEQCVPLLGEADFCAGGAVFMKGQEARTGRPPASMSVGFILVNSLCHQSLFTRTSLMRQHPFNESHRIMSDWEQFATCWHLHHASYRSLPSIVSIYFMDGISSTQKGLAARERAQVAALVFGHTAASQGSQAEQRMAARENKNLGREAVLRNKLRHAMDMKPLARDWEIVRNGVKFLLKDLFG